MEYFCEKCIHPIDGAPVSSGFQSSRILRLSSRPATHQKALNVGSLMSTPEPNNPPIDFLPKANHKPRPSAAAPKKIQAQRFAFRFSGLRFLLWTLAGERFLLVFMGCPLVQNR